jgi:hypothetical protein
VQLFLGEMTITELGQPALDRIYELRHPGVSDCGTPRGGSEPVAELSKVHLAGKEAGESITDFHIKRVGHG